MGPSFLVPLLLCFLSPLTLGLKSEAELVIPSGSCKIADPLATYSPHPESKCELGESLCICDFIARDIGDEGCALNYWAKCVIAVPNLQHSASGRRQPPTAPPLELSPSRRGHSRKQSNAAPSRPRSSPGVPEKEGGRKGSCVGQPSRLSPPKQRPECTWVPVYDGNGCVREFFCQTPSGGLPGTGPFEGRTAPKAPSPSSQLETRSARRRSSTEEEVDLEQLWRSDGLDRILFSDSSEEETEPIIARTPARKAANPARITKTRRRSPPTPKILPDRPLPQSRRRRRKPRVKVTLTFGDDQPSSVSSSKEKAAQTTRSRSVPTSSKVSTKPQPKPRRRATTAPAPSTTTIPPSVQEPPSGPLVGPVKPSFLPEPGIPPNSPRFFQQQIQPVPDNPNLPQIKTHESIADTVEWRIKPDSTENGNPVTEIEGIDDSEKPIVGPPTPVVSLPQPPNAPEWWEKTGSKDESEEDYNYDIPGQSESGPALGPIVPFEQWWLAGTKDSTAPPWLVPHQPLAAHQPPWLALHNRPPVSVTPAPSAPQLPRSPPRPPNPLSPRSSPRLTAIAQPQLKLSQRVASPPRNIPPAPRLPPPSSRRRASRRGRQPSLFEILTVNAIKNGHPRPAPSWFLYSRQSALRGGGRTSSGTGKNKTRRKGGGFTGEEVLSATHPISFSSLDPAIGQLKAKTRR